MEFHRVSFPVRRPPQNASYPCAVLVDDHWDDYTYRTMWTIYLYRAPNDLILENAVKILQRNLTNPSEALHDTILPGVFSELDEAYCSLGQDLKFYEALRAAGSEIYEPYFEAVRDAAYYPSVGAEFLAVKGFRESLLRFSEAEKAFKEARSLFTETPALRSFTFTFQCMVPGRRAPS